MSEEPSSTPLKIAVVLDQPIDVGGGFQQGLNDLHWFEAFSNAGDEVFSITRHRSSGSALRKLGLRTHVIAPNILDHIFFALQLTSITAFAQKFLRIVTPFERKLKRLGVDLVVFVSPSKLHALLQETPFAITVFDDCHRDEPQFSEVRSFGEFERREWLLRNAIPKAIAVFANTEELIGQLSSRYGVARSRFVLLPFAPSSFVAVSEEGPADAKVLRAYDIEPGYLFYPAQFWAHKNHALVLRALRELRETPGISPPVAVFCGSDKGMEPHLRRLAASLGIERQIRWLGFVPSEHLPALYRNASALVMPSFFGPTNLPPLEAWMCGTPVLYPSAFRDAVGEAALLFDYASPRSLAACIVTVQEPEARIRMNRAAANRLRQLENLREEARLSFAAILDGFRARARSAGTLLRQKS